MHYKNKIFICIIIIFFIASFYACTNNKQNMENNNKQNNNIDTNDSNINNSDNNDTNDSNINNNDTNIKNQSKILDVPIISQNPELKCGCEITSLCMLLNYANIKVDKMTLANEIKKDKTKLNMTKDGDILEWGNPNIGFVGDITGENKGFGVYDGPIIQLMEKYIPNKSNNLTGQNIEYLLKSIDNKKPVIVWVTIDFRMPDKYEEWDSNGKKIKVTFDEHAVLLVGYDNSNIYINNPYNEQKNQKVKIEIFEKIWTTMGKIAVSYI